MKNIIAFCMLTYILLQPTFSQVPQSLKYKAIAKDEWGLPLPRKDISLRFSILLGDLNGILVYQEVHYTTTTVFGLMDVNIGEGTTLYGYFEEIDWSASNYYMKIELDPRGGNNFRLEGGDRLLSVPFALYAGNVSNKDDADADPTNELITNLYLSGTYLYLVEGNQTNIVDLTGLQDGTEDADADPQNELQDLSLTENQLILSQSATVINLEPYLDNTDNQELAVTGNLLSISGGNTVELSDQVNDADADPTNEIQDLKLEGHLLSITINGTPTLIDLSFYLDNTDAQQLSIDGHTLSLGAGGSVQLPDSVNDADHDPLNELQELAFEGTMLSISEKNTVDLAGLQDGVNDADADPTNELQMLSIRGDTIFLSEGGWVKLPEQSSTIISGSYFYLDMDNDGFGDMYKPLWIPTGTVPPLHYVANSSDCNDRNNQTQLGIDEICGDGIDQDCDGSDLICLPEDVDNDGDGFTENQGDCDDTSPDIYPNRSEVCNNLDDNCNGLIDEFVTRMFFLDNDRDGFGNSFIYVSDCTPPFGYVSTSGDCNDNNSSIKPGAIEICDGIDNDCDNQIDEYYTPCSLPNVQSTYCSSGQCRISSCSYGYANCNGDDTDGCELVINTNPNLENPIVLSNICGDDGNDVVSYTSNTEAVLKTKIMECNNGIVSLKTKITFNQSGSLFSVYVHNAADNTILKSSTNFNINNREILLSEIDSWGTSDTYDILIRVVFESGQSCGDWELTISGNSE